MNPGLAEPKYNPAFIYFCGDYLMITETKTAWETAVEDYMEEFEDHHASLPDHELIPDLNKRIKALQREFGNELDEDSLDDCIEDHVEKWRKEALEERLQGEEERLIENHPDYDELMEHLTLCRWDLR